MKLCQSYIATMSKLVLGAVLIIALVALVSMKQAHRHNKNKLPYKLKVTKLYSSHSYIDELNAT